MGKAIGHKSGFLSVSRCHSIPRHHVASLKGSLFDLQVRAQVINQEALTEFPVGFSEVLGGV